LRVPATSDTDAPVVKAAGAFFFVTIPIACLEASLYDPSGAKRTSAREQLRQPSE
jgi:hypothetical protein